MKNKEDLAHLVRAMSKSEKRYFTLDAQKGGHKDSRYLELFQAINAQDEYDEQALRERFGPGLPHDKRYLYEAILRSMRDYRSPRSLAARIREMLLDARYLYERGLYAQAETRLQEAKGLATELDDHLVLLEINKELRVLAVVARRDQDDGALTDLLQEKGTHILAITEEFQYLDAGYELLMELRRNLEGQDSAQRTQFLATYPLRPLLTTHDAPTSHRAQRLRHQCLALWAQLEGQQDEMMAHYVKVVDWWEGHPKIKGEEIHRYLRDISNLLHAYSTKGRYQDIPALVDKLEQINATNVYDKSLIFQRGAIYRLMYYINTGQTHGMGQFVEGLEKGLEQHQVGASSALAIQFNMAALLFLHEDFERCRLWCQRIIKGAKAGLRLDIQRGALLLGIVAAYEVLDAEEFDKALRSTQRRYHTKALATAGSFELHALDLLRKIAHAPLNERRNAYRDMATFLNLQRGHAALGLDELLAHYTESRLSRQPMIAIVQRLHRQRTASP